MYAWGGNMGSSGLDTQTSLGGGGRGGGGGEDGPVSPTRPLHHETTQPATHHSSQTWMSVLVNGPTFTRLRHAPQNNRGRMEVVASGAAGSRGLPFTCLHQGQAGGRQAVAACTTSHQQRHQGQAGHRRRQAGSSG